MTVVGGARPLLPSPSMRRWESRLRRATWRQAGGRAITASVALVAVVFLVFAADALIVAVGNLPRAAAGLWAWRRDEIPWNEGLYAISLAQTVLVFPAIYVGYFVVAFLVTLPVSAPLIVFWRDPPRFLLLRPFNRRPLSRGLSRLVRRDVARFGHTYTLADTGIRVPWYVRVPLVLGQFALLSFRPRMIKRPAQVDRLERALSRTWLRNINWCLSWRRVFPVRTNDRLWQPVVERLVHHTTLVFIDLTELRPNVRWEIDRIRELGRADRVIYLLHADAPGEAHAMLSEQLGHSIEPEHVHRYDSRGIRERERFRTALARAIEETGDSVERPMPPIARYLAIAGVAAFALGCLPLLALGIFEALQERLANVHASAPMVVLLYGVATWILLWLSVFWNRRFIGLGLVQTVLLLAFVLSA